MMYTPNSKLIGILSEVLSIMVKLCWNYVENYIEYSDKHKSIKVIQCYDFQLGITEVRLLDD